MNPVQPFFALSTDHYYKKSVNRCGISHIYGFHCQNPVPDAPTVLPDGCIDIMFDLSDDQGGALVCGSVSDSDTPKAVNQSGHTYFGIRFLPGYMPAFLKGILSDFVDNEISLSECSSDPFLAEKIMTSGDLRHQAILLIRECLDSDEHAAIPAGHISASQIALVSAIQKMISSSQGTVRVQDMEEETGYSRRYINEIYHSYSGFSPKEMCQIVRFQAALAELTHNSAISISSLALKYGYYDQPQFNREFRKYLHTTPRKYRCRLQSSHYLDHFVKL